MTNDKGKVCATTRDNNSTGGETIKVELGEHMRTLENAGIIP